MKENPEKLERFEDLVEWASRHILTEFINRGGEGLQTGVWIALAKAIDWNLERDKSGKKKT